MMGRFIGLINERLAKNFIVEINSGPMKLADYLRTLTPAERTALAFRVSEQGSVGYLYQLAGGHRRPSAERARRLEEASGGMVTRQELLPDLFGDLVPAAPAMAGDGAPMVESVEVVGVSGASAVVAVVDGGAQG